MSDADSYVLVVKPSARRASAGAGEWVGRHGAQRAFETKALARRWARELSSAERMLWVQDAPPHDRTGADGYLVSGRRAGRPRADGRREAGAGGGDEAGRPQAPLEQFADR